MIDFVVNLDTITTFTLMFLLVLSLIKDFQKDKQYRELSERVDYLERLNYKRDED